MTLLAQAPLIGYVGLTSLRTRSLATAGRYLALTLVVTAVVFRMSTWRADAIIKYMQAMGSVKAGWFVPWMTLERCLGFLPLGTLRDVLPAGLCAAMSLLFVIAILWGLIKTFRLDPDAGCFAAATLITVCSGCFLLALQEQEAGQLGGYKNYKFISFFLPVFLLASWTIFRQLQSWRAVVRSPAWMVALVAILGANLYSDQVMARKSLPHLRIVDEDLADVRAIAADSHVPRINLLSDQFWESMWLTNFLISKNIDYLSSTYSGREASPLTAEWDLLPRGTWWDQGAFIQWNAVGDRVDMVDPSGGIEINRRYKLARRHTLSAAARDGLALSVKRDGGWKVDDQGRSTIDCSSEPARLVVHVPSDITVRFRAAYRREPASKNLVVLLNGYEVAKCERLDCCLIDRLPLHAGDNILEFRPAPDSDPQGQASPGFTFSALDIFVNSTATAAVASRSAVGVE